MHITDCLIIEDEANIALSLKVQIQNVILADITICNSFNEAISILRNKKFDLIFLDIHLSDKSGIDLIKTFDITTPVIVLSSSPDYAIETYDINNVVDYILKPANDIRLLKAINKALTIQHSSHSIVEDDFLLLRVSRKIIRFDFNQIDYIEAYGIYSKLYFQTKKTVVNEPISNLITVLPPKIFKRVHKSYIINVQKITGFDHKYFFVNDEKIPIGVSYKPSLEALFRLFG